MKRQQLLPDCAQAQPVESRLINLLNLRFKVGTALTTSDGLRVLRALWPAARYQVEIAAPLRALAAEIDRQPV